MHMRMHMSLSLRSCSDFAVLHVDRFCSRRSPLCSHRRRPLFTLVYGRLDEAASLRRKQNRQSVYDSQPQKVRVKSAEQQRLDRQNHILKRAYEMAVATRKQFFKKNLPTFRRFMNASAVRSIEATPTIDDDRPFKELAVQPDLLVDTCDMRDYQLIGLNFLARKHHEGMPCIIGDEMGLGKTLQVSMWALGGRFSHDI